jgi:protein SCO1/2
MKTAHLFGFLGLFAALALVGCGGGAEKKDAADKQYEVKGMVVTVDAAHKTIMLDHEDIPGLMKAMKMPVSLASPKVAEGLQPGDHVQGHLQVKAGEYIITHLEKR